MSNPCECGCGRMANSGRRFIHGHQRGKGPLIPPNPSGLCMCGCGGSTPIATETDRRSNAVKGEHIRFIRGHHARSSSVDFVPVDRGYKTPCWIWQLSTGDNGYGRCNPTQYLGECLAHRGVYRLHKGDIPEGMEIDHRCEVRACVNPDHLEIVTPLENQRRKKNLKLTESDVAAIRSAALAPGDAKRMSYQLGISITHFYRVRAKEEWVVSLKGEW